MLQPGFCINSSRGYIFASPSHILFLETAFLAGCLLHRAAKFDRASFRIFVTSFIEYLITYNKSTHFKCRIQWESTNVHTCIAMGTKYRHFHQPTQSLGPFPVSSTLGPRQHMTLLSRYVRFFFPESQTHEVIYSSVSDPVSPAPAEGPWHCRTDQYLSLPGTLSCPVFLVFPLCDN